MNIGSHLGLGNMILAMKAVDKKGAITELVDNLVQTGQLKEPEELVEAIIAREELCTTGLENGVAIPHPRHGQPHLIEGLAIAFGRKKKGLDFESMDGKPTRLLFLLCAESDTVHLRSLARLSRLLKDSNFRKRLLDAGSPEDVAAAVKEIEGALD